MSKIVNIEDLKNKKLRKKHIIYLLFIVILIYIFYSIYLLVKSPNEIVTIEKGTLTLEEAGAGYIIRKETVLTGNNYKNGLTPIVSEGERAAKGETIFRYSGTDEKEINTKIEEINLKLQEALTKEKNILPTDIKALTDIHTIQEYEKQIEEIASKKAKIAGETSPSGSYIKDLNNQKEEYEKKLTEGSEYITAPVSGVVSYRVDGLENVLTPEDFSNLTEEKLENLELKTGKIISSSTENRENYRQF